jgi:uncharacterized protein Smg (DUF494 family)
MRAAVISVVGASVSFFVPGVDVRHAGQPVVALQPAAQMQPQQMQMQPHLQPQQWSNEIPVVAVPSARPAYNDDGSVRWFAYGLFGALFTMAMRSKVFALSFPGARKAALRRPAARFRALRMSEVAEVDPAWELAREAIALRTTRSESRTDPRSTADEAGFTAAQISEAMLQLPQLPSFQKKRADGYWEDVETDEEKRARAVEVLLLRAAPAADATTTAAERSARYGGPRIWGKDSSSERPGSGATPVSAVAGVVEPTEPQKSKKEKAPKKATRAAWREGLFAPAVIGAKKVMGEQQLKEFRASVIAKHSKVIGNFVDTSESKFGQLVLKRMFEYADKDGNGTLDKEEVRAALLDLGFDFMNEKQIEKLLKDADKDQNDVIDFEEFVQATPKALRINLVKLAKTNGHDLGFLV